MSNSGIFSLPAFKNRGIIKLAPDALVYINGALGTAVVAPASGKNGSINFNDGITAINISSSIEPAGSSRASIEITTPIYNEKSNYWVTVNPTAKKSVRIPILSPMMEVKILMRGRFLVGGLPKYYPVFWGLIISVDESYNGGVWKIAVECGDMLTWWKHSVINKKVGVSAGTVVDNNLDASMFGSFLGKSNPYEVIYALTTQLGQQEFISPAVFGQAVNSNTVYPQYNAMLNNVQEYWKKRFGQLGSMLKMFGARGEQVVVHGNIGSLKTYIKDAPLAAIERPSNATSLSRQAADTNPFVTYDLLPIIASYPSGASFDRMSVGVASDYQSKLEYAVEIAQKIDFEFYQDVNGEFIFKPPFYNINTSSIEPYVIRPNDIVSCNFTTDSEAIITCLRVYGTLNTMLQDAQYGKSTGIHYDVDLVARYGLRYKETPLEYLGSSDSKLARVFAISRMACINAQATTGTITIPGRPELKLGYPIYADHRDSFHYIRSLSHSFDFGGSFSTTIGIMAERTKAYDFSQSTDGLPLKDKIYVLTDSSSSVSLRSPGSDSTNVDTITVRSQALRSSQNRFSSLEQGAYEIQKRTHPDQISATDKSVPFTDENGYRVIGAFPYGRGMTVEKTGIINMDYVANATKDQASDQITTGAANESVLMKAYFNNKVGDISVAGIVNQYIEIQGGAVINANPIASIDKITTMTADTDNSDKKTANKPLVADAVQPYTGPGAFQVTS